MHFFLSHKYPALTPFILLLLFLFQSCASFGTKSKAYSALVEPFENLDTAPLEGRVIVLDPGHGGDAPGVVGRKGLEEKDINLRVALRLKDYLEEANATVIMTREDDRNLIIDRIDSLRGNDLDYRVRLSNENEADLFISLHHNSLLPLNREYNATETYYKMEDSYSSLDAGKLIHRHLAINLQTPSNILKPGNYYVIRSNKRTAILGEASHVSNPQMEKLLKDDEKADLEAKSYFLGILDYFSHGVPEIELNYPLHESLIEEDLPTFDLELKDDGFGGGIDPQTIFLQLNGEDIQFDYAGGKLRARPDKPLPGGNHILAAVVSNLKGNHSLFQEFSFDVVIPPQSIVIRNPVQSAPMEPDFETAIVARVLDKNFNPVVDSTRVVMQLNDNEIFSTEFTNDGEVVFYFSSSDSGTYKYTISSGSVSSKGSIDIRPMDDTSALMASITQNESGIPIQNAKVRINNEFLEYTNLDGRAYFSGLEAGTLDISVEADGYYASEIQDELEEAEAKRIDLSLDTMFDGALFNRIVIIDPEFGGLSTGATGPTGLRAADENMETAMYLVNMLKKAGASGIISRGRGDDTTPHSRVRYANSKNGQLFISLRYGEEGTHRLNDIITYAYPSSSNGKRLAGHVLDSFEAMRGYRGFGPLESAEFVLQQTSSPALIVHLGNITDSETENELYTRHRNREDAYAIFTAIVQYYAENGSYSGQLSGKITDEDNNPLENVLVSLDNAMYLQTNKNGEYAFIHLEPREYSFRIIASGFKSESGKIAITNDSHRSKNIQLKREK